MAKSRKVTLHLRGSSYYIYWREHAGAKQRKVSLGPIDADTAERVRDEKEAALILGVSVPTLSPTLRDWVEGSYLPWVNAGRRKPTTAAHALNHVIAALGHKHLDQLEPGDVERYKANRLSLVKSATVAKEVRMLKAAVQRAVMNKILPESPIRFVSPPRVVTSRGVKFFSNEELARIVELGCKHAPVWRFLANTGLRLSEMVKALHEDVRHLGNRKVLYIESEEDDRDAASIDMINRANKARRVRVVPLNEAAQISLAGFPETHDGRLIDNTVSGLTKAWERTRERAKVKGGVHRLRHTFAAQLVMAGVPLRTIQILLGHQSVTTTEIYAHLAPDYVADSVTRIHLG